MLSELLRDGLRQNLQPSQVLVLARSLPLERFVERDQGKAILLLRARAEEGELITGLMQRYGPDTEPKAEVGPLEFRTAIADPGELERTLIAPRSDAPRFDTSALARWIAVAPCFPVPIAKSSSAFADRISVGRAINKDIVLRSKSISKSHAWFERDPQGTLCVADAGSRNGTTVAGAALDPRSPKAVPDGVDLRIGKLEATVCSGELFWHLAQVV
jgi:hypothetical protein